MVIKTRNNKDHMSLKIESWNKKTNNSQYFSSDDESSFSHDLFAETRTMTQYGTKKCKKDYDCGKNMECLENICYCNPGFYPENDHCIDSAHYNTKYPHYGNQKRYTYDACKSKPCSPASYCENLSNSRFLCHCSIGKYGSLCEKNYSSILFPSFKEKSFLELTKSEINLNDFSIELEFKAISSNGILFYVYQLYDGSGDFISLMFRNDSIEFRIYSNGEDLKSVQLLNKISIGKFHKIFIKKKKKLLFIQLDDLLPIQENSFDSKVTIEGNIILGNIFHLSKFSDKSKARLNMSEGFQGCLQYLKLNDKIYNLSFPSNDIKNGADIDECQDRKCINRVCLNNGRCRLVNDFYKKVKAECVCERGFSGKSCEDKQNPCLSSPCKNSNESICIPTSIGSFNCICSDKYDGKTCEKSVYLKSPYVAGFNGKSYIEKPGLGQNINMLDFVFLSKKPDGILLYNGDLNQDNFIGVKLQNSYVNFVISVFGKYEILISRNPIETHRWNKLRILRENSKFKMFVNADNFVLSSDNYVQEYFNLNDTLFIGGLKDSSKINKKFKMNKGFKGAMQKANINTLYQNDIRLNSIELGGIYSYEGFPCNSSNICENGGICIPLVNNFKCKCLHGFRGKFCQRHNGRKLRHHNLNLNQIDENIKDSNLAIYLDGNSELIYKNRISDITKVQSTNKFEIILKTKISNGLLLFTGNGNLNSYLYLAFINGKLVYTFSLPKLKQVFTLSSKNKLNDNKLHTIIIERNKRKATFSVDNLKLNATFDETNYVGYGNLVTDGYIRLGGYRNLPFGMPQSLYQGFQGCILEFKIDDRLIDLVINNLNTKYYPSVCSSTNENNNQNKTKKMNGNK